MNFTGYFAAAQSLATRTLRLPMSTLSRVVEPSVFQAQEVEGTKSPNAVLHCYFSFVMLISLLIVAALICAADVFSRPLFDRDFAGQTAGYLRVMALASFLPGLQGAYFSYSFSRSRKTALQLGIPLYSLVVHIILSFGIIYLFGAQGASIAFLIDAVLSFMAYYLIGRKIARSAFRKGKFPRQLQALSLLD